jgi:hypothetical protein
MADDERRAEIEAAAVRRDYNGERGSVPTSNGWFPWRIARMMREYLDALKAELERLDAR